MTDKPAEKPTLRKPQFVKIKDLERGRSGYNVYVKVVEAKERQVDTKDGQKITMVDAVVADETGAAKAFFKGEQAKEIKQGATIAIRNGVKKIIKGHISLELDLFGRVTPETVQVKPGNEKNISDEQIKLEPRNFNRRQGGQRGGRQFNNRGGNDRREGGRRFDGRRGRNDDRRDNRNDDRRDNREDDKRDNRQDRRDNRPERRDNRDNRDDRRDNRDNREDRRDNRDRRDERDTRDTREYRDNRDDRRDNYRDNRNKRNDDRDYDRRGGNQESRGGDRDRQYKPRGAGGFQQKRGERIPMLKINEIDPGTDNLRFIAKVLSASLISGRNGSNVRCVLGDETGIVNAFLGESELLAVGKTVALFGAEAKVVKQHIEIQRARVEAARNPIDKVNEKFNLSEKAWVPVD